MTEQIPQRRHLVTALPGPRSQDLMARKAAAVAAGVGTTMPVLPIVPPAASSSTLTATA